MILIDFEQRFAHIPDTIHRYLGIWGQDNL